MLGFLKMFLHINYINKLEQIRYNDRVQSNH